MTPKQQSSSTIGYLLQHVASVMHRQADQVLQERLGIGMSQYRILQMLEQNPKVEQRRLADSLGQTEASISRQVKLLHEKGMLTSRIQPDERRKHITMLTHKGLKVTDAAREVLELFYEPLVADMSPKEQEQLHAALTFLHEKVCVPGKPIACDRAFAIETIYANQEATNT
jgi:DNA-binding MarR family transcriptional regulator